MTSFCNKISNLYKRFCEKCHISGRRCLVCPFIAWLCGSCVVEAADGSYCELQQPTVVTKIIKPPIGRIVSWLTGGRIEAPCPPHLLKLQLEAVDATADERHNSNNPYLGPRIHRKYVYF